MIAVMSSMRQADSKEWSVLLDALVGCQVSVDVTSVQDVTQTRFSEIMKHEQAENLRDACKEVLRTELPLPEKVVAQLQRSVNQEPGRLPRRVEAGHGIGLVQTSGEVL